MLWGFRMVEQSSGLGKRVLKPLIPPESLVRLKRHEAWGDSRPWLMGYSG